MKILKQNSKNHYLRKAVIYLLTYCIAFYTSIPVVMATPTGGAFVEGTGSITTSGTATNVAVDQLSSVIEWDSIDTLGGEPGVRESLNFSQGSLINSAVLNRVSGPETQFYGDLNAEGMRIFIINPSGILFGEGSTVNVNQLVASSLGISNEDFMNGHYDFIAGEGEIGGIINNSDDITATEGVALIGKYVQNNGAIETTNEGGFVVMAAGDRVLLGEPGSNILVEMSSVTIDEEGDGEVINNGEITAPSGTVVLAAGDVYASALALPKVSGGTGRVEQNGDIDTDGTTSDGGGVSLTAADEVILASGSETTANAGTDSDAGLVVVHSKDRTVIEDDALIQVTGGHEPHDIYGDFDDVVETTVEISGDYVNLAGDIDASALAENKRGKIVIDALDITVKDGSIPENPEDNTIYEEWIEDQTRLYDESDQYVSTDVELVAHSREAGNITVEYMNDGVIGIDESGNGGSGDIVLRTKYDTGSITFLENGSGDRTAIHSTAGGNVYMLAGGDNPDTEEIEGSIITGDIISTVPQSAPAGWPVEPGKIRLLTVNGGSITTGELKVEGGSYDEISAIASGDLTINGDVTTYAHQVDEGMEVGQARTCLVSEQGDVEINGEIKVEAHAKYETNADIHIDAGQDIRIDLDGGQILATAFTSATGTADASVKIHAGKATDPENPTETGEITIINPKTESKAIEILAQAGGKKSQIFSNGQNNETTVATDTGTVAELEIDNKRTEDCPECPTPPGLVPPLDPWAYTTHMSSSITGNVFEAENKIGILEIVPGESWIDMGDYWLVDTPHGTLLIAENGDYEYTPDAGFVGEDRFVYQAKVIDTGIETDLVEVTITMVNNTPTTTGGDDQIHMNIDLGNIDLVDLLSDDDNAGGTIDTLEIVDFTQPENGTLTYDSGTGTYTYEPDAGFVGEDSFTYYFTDGEMDYSGETPTPVIHEGTFVITVVNQVPTGEQDTAQTNQGDPVIIDVLANDNDPDNDNLIVVIDGALPEHAAYFELDPETNTFTYTPEIGYVGPDSFTYAVTDGQIGAELVWITVTIWVNAAVLTPAAPLPEDVEFGVSGCPALLEWTAQEVGISAPLAQIWITNTLASSQDIQPCDACANLSEAATVLQDADGSRIAALAQVVNEFVSSDAPISDEQMASVTSAIASNTDSDSQYALAEEYIDSLVAYVGTLQDLGFSPEDAINVATDKYIAPLAEDNAGVATYMSARLTSLEE